MEQTLNWQNGSLPTLSSSNPSWSTPAPPPNTWYKNAADNNDDFAKWITPTDSQYGGADRGAFIGRSGRFCDPCPAGFFYLRPRYLLYK